MSPESSRIFEYVSSGIVRGAVGAAGDAAVGEVSEEGEVSLDGVEEVGEGAGADVQEGVDDDGSNERVHVDALFGGF